MTKLTPEIVEADSRDAMFAEFIQNLKAAGWSWSPSHAKGDSIDLITAIKKLAEQLGQQAAAPPVEQMREGLTKILATCENARRLNIQSPWADAIEGFARAALAVAPPPVGRGVVTPEEVEIAARGAYAENSWLRQIKPDDNGTGRYHAGSEPSDRRGRLRYIEWEELDADDRDTRLREMKAGLAALSTPPVRGGK